VKLPLAIVGASTRAAAASAVRAGFQPITADLFADADLRQIATATRISPYPDGFLDWLRTIEPPAWMYTGAMENHPELVDQMAWIAPLWGNPGDVLTRVRSPRELAHALRSASLLFPETRESPDGLPHNGTWLAKTYQGASGSGVKVLSTEYDSSLATRHSPLATFFQRRIPGTPAAAVFIAADGSAALLGVTQQLIGQDWLGAHGFQYAGSIGPLPMSESARATIQNIGQTIAEQFELVGLFGIDFILNDDEVWTLEVNPRYTASVEIIERITGLHALAAHAAACTGLPNPTSPLATRHSPLPFHGKATLFARRDAIITKVFAEQSLAEAAREPWPTLADVSVAGTFIDAGRPILTVFADGANSDEVERNLRSRVAELERKIYAIEVPS
jgi:uncharacterized protein